MWIARIDVVEKLNDNSEKMVTTTLHLNNNLKKTLQNSNVSGKRKKKKKWRNVNINLQQCYSAGSM